MIALASSRLSDRAAVSAHIDSLLAIAAAEPRHAGIIRDATHVLRADMALRAGQPKQAAQELEQITLEVSPADLNWRVYDYAVLLRVRAYLETAQFENAVRWLRFAMGPGTGPSASQYGVYERDLARALDGLRDPSAAVHYDRFIDAWRNADPELRPQVEAARRRLAALQPDRASR